MTGFRKFGTSDAPITTDSQDDQGISKTAVTDQPWTEQDAEELRRENEKNSSNQSRGSI